jgi:maltose-binding protein MalE
MVELPEIADAQRSEMLARAQAGGGGVDVYNLDVTWTAEFAAAGHLQRLDESRVRTGDFLPGPLSTCRYDDRLWALPFNTDVGLLYFTTTLVDALGAARTRPVVPHYASFSRAIQSEVDAYVRRDRTIVDDDLRARLEASLQGREPPQPG